MRRLKTTGQFERDIRRAKRRGKDFDKLWTIFEALCAGARLARRHRPHKLSGGRDRVWECHIEPDWLLLWHEADDVIVLVRTGTRAGLFG